MDAQREVERANAILEKSDERENISQYREIGRDGDRIK